MTIADYPQLQQLEAIFVAMLLQALLGPTSLQVGSQSPLWKWGFPKIRGPKIRPQFVITLGTRTPKQSPRFLETPKKAADLQLRGAAEQCEFVSWEA